MGTGAETEHELDAFVRREHPRLVGALSLYLGDAGAAEELAQEALLRAYRRWDEVSRLESPGGWVHRVAMNLAASWSRSRAAGRRAAARLEARAVVAFANQPGPTDAAEALAVRNAVRALPEQQRRALVLRYYADLSVADTAAAMGCPEGTVKTLTSRAVAALRTQGWEVHE
jgi:RNA polymerase sigma-70 factor (ECF subfamily)